MLIRRLHRFHWVRTTAALLTILSTLANLSVPFAQARNDQNHQSYGQISRTRISVIVERNLKIGNFTVSFTDLSIPVAGVPMEVTRTYDSRDKRVGDFGFGWTLGLHNIRVEKSSVLGLKWYETVSQEAFPNYCVEPTGSHVVTVTFPGGKVFKFQAAVAPHRQRFAPITGGALSFTPLPGTVGKLEVMGSADFQVEGSIPGPVNLLGLGGGVGSLTDDRRSYQAEASSPNVVPQTSSPEPRFCVIGMTDYWRE